MLDKQGQVCSSENTGAKKRKLEQRIVTEMKKTAMGIPAVLISVLFWGVSFVSTKVILAELPPISIAFFRQFAALVPLIAIMLIKKESFRLSAGEWLRFAAASLFGIVLYFVFENTGLTMTTASSASMLVAAIPIFALVAESITGRKRISRTALICILTSVIGVYFVIFENGMVDFSSKTFLGNLLVFGAMISWIIYTFLSKRLGERYSSIKMTTFQCFLSIPLFIPFVLHEIPQWRVPSPVALGNFLFLAIFCSALAYVFYLYGIQTLGPVIPSAFLNLIPVVTIITGAIFLKENMTLLQLAGAILIMGSLTLLSLKNRPEKQKNEKADASCGE